MTQAVVFDAYGTLLDIHSPARRLADRLGPDWHTVSATWRSAQMEMSWIHSLADRYVPFDVLTETALRATVPDLSLVTPLLVENGRPDVFADVRAALETLTPPGAILSNGTPASLERQLAPIRHLFDAVLSADTVHAYKPDPRVYRLATDRFACAAAEIAFVSSNPWDAFGAHAFGFRVVWVNREGKPDIYGLRGSVTVIDDLSALAGALA